MVVVFIKASTTVGFLAGTIIMLVAGAELMVFVSSVPQIKEKYL